MAEEPTMSKTIYGACVADAELKDMLTSEPSEPIRFYARGTLGRGGVPATPRTPYVMWGEGGARSTVVHEAAPDTGFATYTFYTYDNSASFEVIKAIHRRIRRVVEALNGTTTEEGMIVTEAKWTSTGPDSYDPVSNHNVKTQSFQVVGKV